MIRYLLLIPIFFLAFVSFGQESQLTFRVDMNQQDISPNGVHVAGSFQLEAGFASDWDPATTSLTDDDADGVYEVTVSVPPGVYHYKFINGASWSEDPELPPATCAVDDGAGNYNREVSIGTSNLQLPVVPFNDCNVQIIFSVNMSQESVPQEGVHVMGNFQAIAGYENDWNPSAIPLMDFNSDGIYEARVSMPVNGIFEYKFVKGNQLAGAESVPETCGNLDDGGNINRVIEATAEVSSTPSFCFSTCETCDGSLIPTTDYSTYWWNDAVFYEIFVRSFYDSNGDGRGDFEGLTQKLDYLNDGDSTTTTDLGITGIWLMPMMESPSYHGYDVTNYYEVEPDYGSMADFENFLAEAHNRGIKVIIDFVINHSSDQHPWFQQSASDINNTYRDWYIWSENDPGFNGPWGQEVWHYRNTDYYYGLFWGGMPDLNWDTPELKAEMWDITRFWLDKGVDGYRLDAIKYLDEDGTQLENTPETFEILEEFNNVYKTARADAFTVGEVWSGTSSIIPYVTNSRLDAAFEFDLSYAIINGVRNSDPRVLYDRLNIVSSSYPALQYATFLTNHDQNRIIEEFGGNLEHMKQAASLYLTMPGVPFLYYGEEVGMKGTKPDEDIRKPMQWSTESYAGFTTGTPWRNVNSNYAQFNVEVMEQDPNSLLNHYKRLIHIRNDQETLRRGYYLPVDAQNNGLFAYARVYEEEAAIIVSNFTQNTMNMPVVSLSASTLPEGDYTVTSLTSKTEVGNITINAQGGIEEWVISEDLNPGETLIFLISNEPQELVVSVDGVDQPGLAEMALYPNPASNDVLIRVSGVTESNKVLQVMDLTGKILLESEFNGGYYRLITGELKAGTYIVNLNTADGVFTERLVVVK